MGSSVSKVVSQGALMKTEWRSLSWDEQARSSLIDAIKEYKPLRQVGVSHARVLLLGPVNVGKSSFFNTINSIFRNHVTAQAPVGSPLDEVSITTKLRAYEVRNGREGKILNFRIVDTMGIEEERKQGFDPSELPYILDGHVPENHQFDSKGNVSQEMTGFIKLPKLSDRIHCCVMVLEAASIDQMGEGLLNKISDMRGKITGRGIPLIVLLTKIDKACSQTASNVSLVYRSSAIRNLVAQTSVKIGIPVSHILPVKNYTHEIELDAWVDVLALSALQQMLRFTDNFFDECLASTDSGYVQPENPSDNLWTQNATLPNFRPMERVKQVWASNGKSTPTAVANRIPNNVSGSTPHRPRMTAAEVARASPKSAEISLVHEQASPVERNTDEATRISGEENEMEQPNGKSPIKIGDGVNIPGSVPQEAA